MVSAVYIYEAPYTIFCIIVLLMESRIQTIYISDKVTIRDKSGLHFMVIVIKNENAPQYTAHATMKMLL